MPRVAAMLCISTLTLLLLATSCMCDNNARRLLSVKPTPTVELGQAQYFTVLGASMVTTAGPSTVDGLLGVSPAAASTITGSYVFTEVLELKGIAPQLSGETVHDSATAKDDASIAYLDAAGRLENAVVIPTVNIGGKTFGPGLYTTAGALEVSSGTLYLSGEGVYIFQMATTLTVSTGLKMVLTDGAKASDVFWQVGTSATFKTGSEVVGTVMAYASIAMGTQATIQGRLFALNGAVTLIQNTIEFPFTA
jgi:hypothetical protein